MNKSAESRSMITGAEKISYGFYFMGQNIMFLLIYMYMNTYFTDVGISAMAVAGIALVVKVWDAINDPIFGGLIDKVHFKKGKFLPWLRISLIGIPVTTVLLFAIPTGVSPFVKILWASIAYILWDTAYTMCDVPIFGLVTTMTSVQQDRTTLNAIGRVFGTIATLAVVVVIPSFRIVLGGWTSTVIVLAVLSAVVMLPICLTAKERVHASSDKEPEIGLKEMFTYLKSNKYLLVYYIAFLVSGSLGIASNWGLYIARYCLNSESVVTTVGLITVVPSIVIGLMVPALTKKIDKFKLYYGASVVSLIILIIRYFIGYSSLTAFIAGNIVATIPGAITGTILYMFTPDCAEYGQYKTGINAPGVTFATQTFFAKLMSAFSTVLGSVTLTLIGFVEGEGAEQAAGFADKLWACSILVPALGAIMALVILRQYKLNDHDVELMAKCNSGEISREDAAAQMINTY